MEHLLCITHYLGERKKHRREEGTSHLLRKLMLGEGKEAGPAVGMMETPKMRAERWAEMG